MMGGTASSQGTASSRGTASSHRARPSSAVAPRPKKPRTTPRPAPRGQGLRQLAAATATGPEPPPRQARPVVVPEAASLPPPEPDFESVVLATLSTLDLAEILLSTLNGVVVVDTVMLGEGGSTEQPPVRTGLSEAGLALLPELQLTDAFLAAPNSPKECSICLQDLVVGDWLRGLPCAHYLHRACVDPWLRTKDSCPVCRLVVS
eukprot:g18856.t1